MIGLVAAVLLQTATLTPPAGWTVYGPGIHSCGRWTNARRNGGQDNADMQIWLAGFISGSNSILSATNRVSNLLEGSDMSGAAAWVDNYCTANPLAPLSTAARALSSELIRRAAER